MISTLHEKRFVIVVFFLILAALLGIVPSLAQTGGSNNIYLPTVSNQFDPAWLWHDAQRLKLSPSPDAYDPMPLAIDSAGQPVLIYDTYYTPRYIYYTYPSAQGWITPTQIADTLGTSYTLYPPARDEQGKLHLLWSNSLGTGVSDPYRLMYASLDKGVLERGRGNIPVQQ